MSAPDPLAFWDAGPLGDPGVWLLVQAQWVAGGILWNQRCQHIARVDQSHTINLMRKVFFSGDKKAEDGRSILYFGRTILGCHVSGDAVKISFG